VGITGLACIGFFDQRPRHSKIRFALDRRTAGVSNDSPYPNWSEKAIPRAGVIYDRRTVLKLCEGFYTT
jgi:hypothetical protein